MNRIAFMVIKNFWRVPAWFYHIWKYGRPEDNHTEIERYSYMRKVVKKVNKTGRVEIEVHGSQKIPEEEGFILFPNHQGLFDVLALIESLSHPFGIVVKKEVSNIILVKQVRELLRGISIDRSDVRSSMKVIAKMTEEVKAGRNYIIFAEGTRSRNGNHILDFKAGSFKSAVNAGCPIIPVALIDSFKPFDVNSIRREKVQVHYLEPIRKDQYMGLKTVEIADLVRNQIQNVINVNILENV